jgi:flagellar basal body rod protein FlgG
MDFIVQKFSDIIKIYKLYDMNQKFIDSFII